MTGDTSSGDSNSDPDHDYRNISPPPDLAPEEFSYVQRRAVLLDRVLEVGGPGAVSNVRLAEHFDVNRSTIKRDFDALGEYLQHYLDEGADVDVQTLSLHWRLLDDLLTEDDWRAKAKAWEIHRSFAEWVGDRSAEHEANRDGADADVQTASSHTLDADTRKALDRAMRHAEQDAAPMRVDTDGGQDDTSRQNDRADGDTSQ